MSRITFTSNLEAAAKSPQLIVEAIIENLTIKQDMFKKLDKMVRILIDKVAHLTLTHSLTRVTFRHLLRQSLQATRVLFKLATFAMVYALLNSVDSIL